MEAWDNPQNFYLVTKGMAALEWTGERYVPAGPDTATHYDHLHRYAFASGFVRGKKILDLGYGEGYGSFLLAQTAGSVLGIETDETSVNHARRKYIKDNLQFKVGDARNVPLDGEKIFDIVVCFELLEHIEEHAELLREVKRLLKDDGLLIISTPNKLLYSDERNFHNPFHLKELYFTEFADLLKKYFKNVSFLGQKIFPVSNIWTLDRHYEHWEEFCIKRIKDEFQYVNSEAKNPFYFIALASDYEIEPSFSSYLVDTSCVLLKETPIAHLEAELKAKQERITKLEANILAFQDSLGGRMLTRYRRLKQSLLPLGSRRRAVYEWWLKQVKRLI